jgi:hypothetical protein
MRERRSQEAVAYFVACPFRASRPICCSPGIPRFESAAGIPMRLIFRAPVVLQVESAPARAVAIFFARLLRATIIPTFVFLGHLFPLGQLRGFAPVVEFLVRALDLPIALAAQALPEDWRPFTTWFQDPNPFAASNMVWLVEWRRFILVGLPAYMALFYGGDLVLNGYRRMRQTHQGGR